MPLTSSGRGLGLLQHTHLTTRELPQPRVGCHLWDNSSIMGSGGIKVTLPCKPLASTCLSSEWEASPCMGSKVWCFLSVRPPLKPTPERSQRHKKKNRFCFSVLDRPVRLTPKEMRLITTSHRWTAHTSDHPICLAVGLIGTWGKIAVRTFRPHNGMHVQKCFSLPGSDEWRQKKQRSVIFTASPCHIIATQVVSTAKLQGLIMKRRQCQSLNSDFPAVTSLGSITSSFIVNSRSLVSPERRRKDEVMEKRKKWIF